MLGIALTNFYPPRLVAAFIAKARRSAMYFIAMSRRPAAAKLTVGSTDNNREAGLIHEITKALLLDPILDCPALL